MFLPRQEKTFLSLNIYYSVKRLWPFSISYRNYRYFKFKWFTSAQFGTKTRNYIVMVLLRNLNVVSNLMNGTRFIVQNMYDHSLDLESITGQETNWPAVFIAYIELIWPRSYFPFSFTRRQFPIRISLWQ